MHSLHKILINVKQFGDLERDDLISEVRSYAESETDCFYETAYDWRETDCAGRWSDIYPENVMLGKEKPGQILKEVLQCRASQEEELDMCLQQLGSLAECSLVELKQKLWTSNSRKQSIDDGTYLAPYLIKNIGKLLNGDYYYDSFFFDTSDFTAKISSKTIEEIKSAPQDWALVFFDQHF